MGRLMAVDYGRKRTGIAVTDELQLIANALTTVSSKDLIPFLKDYFSREKVDVIVIGEPRQMNNEASEAAIYIEPFIRQLRKVFPGLRIDRMDERFTSKMAFQTMLDAGLGKQDRRNKSLIDSISATIILQSYMESQIRTPGKESQDSNP